MCFFDQVLMILSVAAVDCKQITWTRLQQIDHINGWHLLSRLQSLSYGTSSPAWVMASAQQTPNYLTSFEAAKYCSSLLQLSFAASVPLFGKENYRVHGWRDCWSFVRCWRLCSCHLASWSVCCEELAAVHRDWHHHHRLCIINLSL